MLGFKKYEQDEQGLKWHVELLHKQDATSWTLIWVHEKTWCNHLSIASSSYNSTCNHLSTMKHHCISFFKTYTLQQTKQSWPTNIMMKLISSCNIVIIVTNTIDGLPSLDDEHQCSKQLIE
jgi:hypothetical protein